MDGYFAEWAVEEEKMHLIQDFLPEGRYGKRKNTRQKMARIGENGPYEDLGNGSYGACARILDTFGPIVGESYGGGFLGVALLQSAHGNSPYAVVQLYSDHLLGHAFEAIWGLDKALQKIESCESMIEVPQYYFPLLMTANVYHLETIAIRRATGRAKKTQ